MLKSGRNNPPKASLILAAGCSGRLSSTSTISTTRPVAMEYCRLSICHPVVTMGRTQFCPGCAGSGSAGRSHSLEELELLQNAAGAFGNGGQRIVRNVDRQAGFFGHPSINATPQRAAPPPDHAPG